MQNHTTSLFAKPTPLNINFGSDRFSMFNKERDISGGGKAVQFRARQRERADR